MKCRNCKSDLKTSFVDLGSSPYSNSYLNFENLNEAEKWFPLRVLVCNSCWLVQTQDIANFEDIFDNEYAYFSSFSTTLLEHSSKYVEKMIQKYSYDTESFVVEVASNDGYLLQNFVKKNIPCLGIEPTKNTAKVAKSKGIKVVENFFDEELALKLVKRNKKADLMIANNVLAHVPDILGFLKSFNILLKEDGIATFEFPHVMSLIRNKQFDTIYHEHFSYLSLTSILNIFPKCGLRVFDVEEINTHGGSLRVYACKNNSKHDTSNNVSKFSKQENNFGINTLKVYSKFQSQCEKIKHDFLHFLLDSKLKNKKVIAYGAAAKGTTILNFSGVKDDLLSYVVDKNPAKFGKFMPGSRIPIFEESVIKKDKPDYVVIFPWNLSKEIKYQLDYIREWNGKFVILLPELVVN